MPRSISEGLLQDSVRSLFGGALERRGHALTGDAYVQSRHGAAGDQRVERGEAERRVRGSVGGAPVAQSANDPVDLSRGLPRHLFDHL